MDFKEEDIKNVDFSDIKNLLSLQDATFLFFYDKD